MPKTMNRTICGILILIMLVTVIAITSCAKKPEPGYAGSIAEGILLAMNENDYAKYSEHLDEAMKKAIPEAIFKQTNLTITAKIGNYISKEFWKVESKDGYTIVFYKAKFTQEPEYVIVKVVFQEAAGEIYVSGLWFDSPKLREK